jgi:hypothetical protein
MNIFARYGPQDSDGLPGPVPSPNVRQSIQTYARPCQHSDDEGPHHKSRLRVAVELSFPVMRTAFPVIAAAFPCSAFSLPCYRITAKTVYKPLISKDNKSNKMPKTGKKKFLSLFRPINRENCPARGLDEIRRRPVPALRNLALQFRGACRR